MNISQPTTPISSSTPLPDAAAGAPGNAGSASDSLHVHPFATSLVRFQNAADASKEIQFVSSGTVTTSSIAGNIFTTGVALTWPTVFGSTPFAAAGATVSVQTTWPGNGNAPTTTGWSVDLCGSTNTSAGIINAMGIG